MKTTKYNYVVELWMIIDGIDGHTETKMGTYLVRATTESAALIKLKERLKVSLKKRELGCFMSMRQEFRVVNEVHCR